MKELNLQEIQKIELNILLALKKICDDNDLRLYLCGGTLLGAVRHSGFIPWDDDIDVCMPRPDYNRLIFVLHQKDKLPRHLQMICFEDGNFTLPYMKIFDKRTHYQTQYFKHRDDTGIWIDIFPYDGLPEDNNEVKKIYKTIGRYRKYLMLNMAVPSEGKNFVKRILKPAYIALIKKIYPAQKSGEKIVEMAQRYPYEETEKVGAVTWGLYGLGERVNKSEYEIPYNVNFEGYSFQTMSCWETYLTGLYGDYMKLPPKEKRTTHNMEVWFEDGEEI